MKISNLKLWHIVAGSLAGLCALCAGVLFVIAAPYSVTDTQGFSYSSPHVGGLTVISGWPRINGTPTQHNWLYLMMICPGVNAATSDSRHSGINHDVMSNPLFDYDWETQTGTAHVSFRWNMWFDTISIGRQTFRRKNGNVFVVVRKPTGELATQQCGTIGARAELPEIVNHIRKQLPKDDLVASVRFYDAQ